MLPNTSAAIKKLDTLTRHSRSNSSEKYEEENGETTTHSDRKYKLKEYRDMYLNAVDSNNSNNSNSNSNSNKSGNSRLSANIYDTEDYIHTLTNKTNEYVYPFIDGLSLNIPTGTFAPNKRYNIHVCVYRVFKSGGNTLPFLQFKLLKQSASNELIFPSFKYERIGDDSNDSDTGKSCINHGNDAIMRWFKAYAKDIKFKGFIKTDGNAPEPECYLIYEETITSDRYKTLLRTELKNMTSTENWWWVCTHEIFNKGMVLHYPVSSIVRGLFASMPLIMFLYDKNGFTYESPTVLYTGFTEGSSLDEIRLIGPRKLTDDNNITNPNMLHKNVNENRMYGSQYYFYDLDDVFRNACYTYDSAKHKYKRITGPHIFRYAVFLGVIKVTMFDTDNTTTSVSINGAATFHDTKWEMEGFESVFHGKYKFGGRQPCELSPVFSIFDNTQFVGLSCHEVDASTVPSEFSDTVCKMVKLI